MSEEYDVKDVEAYIAEVEAELTPLGRVNLWLSLCRSADGCSDLVRRFHSRFFSYGLATRVNILFRFVPLIERVVCDHAKALAARAREVGEM